MSHLLRHAALFAALFVVFGAAPAAQASHIRKTINRRQHPGKGFFVPDHTASRHILVQRSC